MDELTFVTTLRQKGIDLHGGSLEKKSLAFSRALKILIPPRSLADRSAFRNLAGWVTRETKFGRFDEDAIFRRVLDFALEASGPQSRNPAAVFMHICRKELGYHPQRHREVQHDRTSNQHAAG